MACNSCGKTKTHDSVKITSEIKSGQKVNAVTILSNLKIEKIKNESDRTNIGGS